jgi:hypothetical protein
LVAPETQSDKTWLLQVVVPAALWVIVYFLLAGLFTIIASVLFGLTTASWAAKDCSKMQIQGTRVLGIVFKPIVVFTVCAFLLWGFGIIWYLTMRQRIMSAPVVFESENVAA